MITSWIGNSVVPIRRKPMPAAGREVASAVPDRGRRAGGNRELSGRVTDMGGPLDSHAGTGSRPEGGSPATDTPTLARRLRLVDRTPSGGFALETVSSSWRRCPTTVQRMCENCCELQRPGRNTVTVDGRRRRCPEDPNQAGFAGCRGGGGGGGGGIAASWVAGRVEPTDHSPCSGAAWSIHSVGGGTSAVLVAAAGWEGRVCALTGEPRMCSPMIRQIDVMST